MIYKSGTPSIIKDVNKGVIEDYLRINKVATKPQIAEATNISLVTVTKIVNSLLEEQKIISCGIEESTGGRKAQRFSLNPNYVYTVGLYYINDEFYGFVSNTLGEVVIEKEYAVKNKDSSDILQQIYQVIDDLIDLNKNKPICTIGIGIPGVVVDGTILKSNSLSGLKGLPIIEKLEEKYGVKVLVENDINLITIGFCHENKSDNIRQLMMIYLCEGVGAGIVVDGKLYHGKTNFAGEIGYLPLKTKIGGNNEIEFNNVEQVVHYIYTEKRKNPNNRLWMDAMIDVTAEVIICISSIFNPETIAINETLNHNEIEKLKNKVADVIGLENTPQIAVFSNAVEYMKKGIISLCLEAQTQNLKIYNK